MSLTGPEQTYLAMLLMPHNLVRAQLQSHMASARDAIALANDTDAETVQNAFEERARVVLDFLNAIPSPLKTA